jgi:predicted nucleic acid-binding protein
VKVVSDAGPLIALGKLGRLGLALRLYDEILIPREVYNEVVVNGLRLGASEAQAVDSLVRQDHICVVEIVPPSPLPAWAESIDVGELYVILVAQQHAADWALIDNAHARRAARQAGMRLKGTIGLLLDAFRQGHLTLEEFELVIQDIQTRPELWISERLCELALVQARQQAKR